MLKLQKQMIEHANRQSIIDNNRIKQIEEIIRNLRKDFIKTNLFLQSSGDKRQQALKLVSEEKHVHAQFKESNKNLAEGIETLKEFRTALSHTVKELEPYEHVLEQAAAQHEVWTSSKDVMYRCDAMS